MQIIKKDLPRSQIELLISLEFSELEKYFDAAVKKISEAVKIAGFRPGKAPFDIVKQQVGEMAILEEAGNMAINKTLGEAVTQEIKKIVISRPEVQIVKLAPENPFEYKAILTILPEVKLGDYKDLKIKKTVVKEDEKELASTLDKLAEMRVKEVIADRAVADKDKVLLKVEMFLDNVPIDGGQAPQTAVVLGHEYLVPGFDKQIIGMNKGDKKEFSLPYPTEHHHKMLAGKKVDFKIEVLEVYTREMPALDDEFAKLFGMNSLDQLKETLNKNILAEKEKQADDKAQSEIMDAIIEKSKFDDLPDEMITAEADALVHEMAHSIEHQGGKFDDYLQSMKKSRQEFMLDMMPQAIKRIKGALVLRTIAVEEKVNVETDEIEKRRELLLKQYKGNTNTEAQIKANAMTGKIHNTILTDKVAKLLLDWNIAKDAENKQK